jgi:RNase P subunit RPR2
MTCLRCAGFMVEYHFIDIDVSSARYDERLTAWRCVNCGYISEAGYGCEPACETLLRPQ